MGLPDLLPRKSGFNPKSVHMIFGVDKVSQGQVVLQSVFPCHYHFTKAPYSYPSVYYSYQTDKEAKPGKLPKNQCCFGNRGALRMKYLFVFKL